MSDMAMMLELPEVRHLVDKIPIAAVRIKPTALHLRFFQHAKESGMSLKRQCELLEIPWHARKVPPALACKAVLEVAWLLSASAFSMELPKGQDEAVLWADSIIAIKAVIKGAVANGAVPEITETSLIWLARHWNDFGADKHAAALHVASRPITNLETKPKTIVDRLFPLRRARAAPVMYRGRQLRVGDIPEDAMVQIAYGGYGGGGRALVRIVDEVRDADGWRFVDFDSPQGFDLPAEFLEPFAPGGRYGIRLLNQRDEFVEEGQRMLHCAAQYFDKAVTRRCYIASIYLSETGAKYATVEYSPEFIICQIKGRANSNDIDPLAIELAHSFADHLRRIRISTTTKKRAAGTDVEVSAGDWTGLRGPATS